MLDPQGKKCIFIRYLEHSKGYVFISELANKSITELESKDAILLETDFPYRGETNLYLHLFEVDDANTSTNENLPIKLVE